MPMRRAALLIVALSFLFAGQACLQAKAKTHGSGSRAVKIAVPIGKTVGDFTYSKSGALSYQGKPFHPAVQVDPESVLSFRISLLKDRGLAGAIAEDGDGKNLLYLLELATRTATPLPKAEAAPAAQKIFWSPSGRYMVAYCSYEGEGFLGLDLQTKKVVEESLGPDGEKAWTLSGEPHWAKGKDTLVFPVDEICNVYGESDCSSDQVLAKYVVALDPATLKTKARKVK